MTGKRILSLALVLLMSAVLAGSVPYSTAKAETQGKLVVEVFDRGNMPIEYGSPTNNAWTQWIVENFGKPNNIDITFQAVPRSEEVPAINTMMSAQNAPDIIFTYRDALFYDYAAQGGLTALDSLLNEYGKELKDLWGEDVLKYGRVNGSIYAIYAKRHASQLTEFGHKIRKDWLDKIGYTLERNADGFYHMSIEDLESVLYQWKGTDFDGTGAPVFPIGMSFVDSGAHTTTPIIHAFWNAAEITDEMKAAYFTDTIFTNPLIPGTKDGLQWLNKLFNDGLMDPDWAVDRDKTILGTEISSGRIGYLGDFVLAQTGPNESLDTLYQNNPDAEFVAFQLDNKYGQQIQTNYPPTGMIIMVPVFSKNAKEAVQYLNWLSDLDVDRTLRYGFEGEHWSLSDDGIPVPIDADHNNKTRISVSDLHLMYNGDPILGVKAAVANILPRIKPLYEDGAAISLVGGFSPYPFGQVIEAEAKYATNLTSKYGELLVRSIMAKPEEFDDVYTKMTEEFLGIGAQAMYDEKITLYRQQNP